MVKIRRFSIICGVTAMAAFSCGAQTPAEAASGVQGIITVSPAKPGPIRQGEPASVPLANATFGVDSKSGEVASFTTDEQGHFRVVLPPGHYKVGMKGRKSSIGHFGPFEVDVMSGKMTDVQWECDSGMR